MRRFMPRRAVQDVRAVSPGVRPGAPPGTCPGASPGASAGFSLIDLLLVVSILVVLVAMLVPAVSHARNAAHAATCATHLRTLRNAVYLYALNSNDAAVPPQELLWDSSGNNIGAYYDDWTTTLLPYIGKKDNFNCPTALREIAPRSWVWRASTYGINSWINKGVSPTVPWLPPFSPPEVFARRPYGPPPRLGNFPRPAITPLAVDGFVSKFDQDGGYYFYDYVDYMNQPYPLNRMVFTGHSGAANVVYLDGHVERLDHLLTHREWFGKGDFYIW